MALFKSQMDALAIRQEVKVTPFCAEQYDARFPPTSLMEFSAWLAAVVEDVPDEYLATTTIEFESVGSYYDSHYAKVEVSYYRPETNQEWEARKARVLAQFAYEDARERAIFETLKAKFEA